MNPQIDFKGQTNIAAQSISQVRTWRVVCWKWVAKDQVDRGLMSPKFRSHRVSGSEQHTFIIFIVLKVSSLKWVSRI